MAKNILIVNLETGEVEERDLTPEEEANQINTATKVQAEAETFRRRQTRLEQIKDAALTPTVKTKLKDGVALTAGEMQLILRWLVFDAILDDLVD